MTRSPGFAIDALDRDTHERNTFSCGHTSLDTYLKTQASQDIRRRVAVVFVATTGGDARVAGYYSLAQASVRLDTVPARERKRLPRYPEVPVTLLGRLAVDRTMQGRGLGAILLGDACRRATSVAAQVAATAVIVDAIDQRAVTFYEKFGFVRLDGTATRLMLPMATIIAGMEER